MAVNLRGYMLASGEATAAAAETFRRALAARGQPTLADDDIALLEGVFADHVISHGAGLGAQPVLQSRRDRIGTWNELTKDGERAPRIEVVDVCVDPTHVIALLELSSPDGEAGTVKQANIFHLDADGRAYEFWGIADDQAAIKRLLDVRTWGNPGFPHAATSTRRA